MEYYLSFYEYLYTGKIFTVQCKYIRVQTKRSNKLLKEKEISFKLIVRKYYILVLTAKI